MERGTMFSTYTDKNLVCRDCSQPFTFTAGEQEFHPSRGVTNEPGRCPDCRAARKARNGGVTTGNNFNADRGGCSAGSGGYGSGGYAPRAPRQMFDVRCDGCAKDTQVPFEPRG